MHQRSGKHQKQIRSDASNLITVTITLYNGTYKQHVSIGLINCQSVCNKSDEISDVIKNIDLDVLIITEIWLTSNVWHRKMLVMWLQQDIHSMMQLGFTRKVGELIFELSVHVAIIYRLHGNKRNDMKAADFVKEVLELVDSLGTNNSHLLIFGDFKLH